MIAMIDNYDSFTYNIVQELREMEADLRVFRNDAITVDALDALAPAALVVSPGPGRPSEAGISMDAIRRFADRLVAARIMHGKVSEVTCDGEGVFKGLGARPFKAMRYHSLCIDPATLPDCLVVSATAEDGCIMGVRHRELPVHGVQFHPESIMTPSGKRMLRNFLRMAE